MKNILITGASKGIGLATAKALAVDVSCRIILLSRSGVQEKLPENIISLEFDLVKGEYVRLKQQISQYFEHIDILINNAGLLVNKPFLEQIEEEMRAQFEVNILAPMRLIKSLSSMLSSDAHIVNITSMGGVQGSMKFPGLATYSASKGALNVFTEALAAEFSRVGKIKVNALALGAVQTEMLQMAFPNYQAPLLPEQMAVYVAEFALNGGRYFNGKVLPVALSTP